MVDFRFGFQPVVQVVTVGIAPLAVARVGTFADQSVPQIGIGPAKDVEVAVSPKQLPHLGAQSSIKLVDHDKVVSVNGQKVTTGVELSALLAQQPLGPIDLVLERRPSKEEDPEQKQPARRVEARAASRIFASREARP